MNEPSSFGYQEEVPGQAPVAPSGPAYPGQYKFSPDELRVLSECNRESFYQRSMPLGTLLGLGAFAAVQSGHLKPNPRFGAFPKVTLAVIVGYFVGKISYQQACAEKLMALPGSYIGQLLRDRRDGKVTAPPMSKPPSSMLGAGPNDIYSDAGPGNSLDLDTDRPIFDDSYRPDTGVISGESPVARPTSPMLSYDELRRRNRGDHADAKQDPYRMDPSMTPPIARPRPPPSAASPHTNKYGDVID
ncbi:unnamed protein product [Diatraea saccharalis]|uniref:OCIA domain-containing protein n=1 Tax=Diatraea saccharalis TaxID=40085 RepID=A0A9N9N0N9_9NEOP|nr:unnamed protein product [Diatraea saccharalis]